MTVGEGDTGLVFLNGKDIFSLKTEELKAELNKRGLKKSGNKCTLVERLRAAMISEHTVKCRKISPGAYIFQRPFLRGLFLEGLIYIRRGLSTEGNLPFKIDWASLIVGSKFAVFALFCFVFEGNFPSTSPRGAYIWRGDLTEGFFRYQIGGLIFGGPYALI